MRVFPYQDGDQLIELVEKREYDLLVLALHDMTNLLESEKSTRNHIIQKSVELERELNAAKQERADFGALVDKLERELNAARAMIESLEDALIEIEASLYEDESENAAGDACWHVARKALKKLKEYNQ